MGTKELIIRWDLDPTKVEKGIKGLEGRVKKFEGFVGQSMKRAGVAVIGIAGAAAYVGTKFEQAMIRVGSNANATESELKALRGAAAKMGEETVFSASQAADALYNLTSAGLSANQSIGTLSPTLNLAAAESVGLAESASLMTNSLAQFELGIEDADRVANALSATVSGSNQKLYDLGESLQYAGGQANLSGVSFEETLGVLGLFANVGQRGSVGGNLFANAMRAITNEAKALKPFMKGVDLEGDGLATTLDKLSANGLTAAKTSKLLGARSRGLAFLMKFGGDAVRDMTGKVTDTTVAQRKAGEMMNTTEGDLKTFGSVAEATGIVLFEAFGATPREAIQFVTGKVRDLKGVIIENEDSIKKWVENGWNRVQGSFEWILAHGPAIHGTVVGLGTAFVTMKIGAVALNLQRATIAAGGLNKALKTMAVIARAHPVLLIASAVGIATGMFFAHRKELDEVTKAYQDSKKAVSDYKDQLSGLRSAGALEAEIKGLDIETTYQKEIVKRIQEQIVAIQTRRDLEVESAWKLNQVADLIGAQKKDIQGITDEYNDQITVLQQKLFAEGTALGIDAQSLALAKEKLEILKSTGKLKSGAVEGVDSGEVDAVAKTGYAKLKEQDRIRNLSFANQVSHYEAELDLLKESGDDRTEEAAKIEIKISELRKAIGKQRTADMVLNEYELGQMTAAARITNYENELLALEEHGDLTSEKYGQIQVKILEAKAEIYEAELEAETIHQQNLLMVQRAGVDAAFAVASGFGQAIIAGEKNLGKAWVGIRKQILGNLLNQTLSHYQAQLMAAIFNSGKETAVAITGEGTKTAAKVAGVTARVGLSAAENAQKAVDIGTDTAKVASGVSSFFAPLGPFGIPLAVATIAGFVALISKVGKGKAYGGLITGPGGDRTDNILTPTSPGEYVFDAPAVRSIGVRELERARSTRSLPAFGGGGGGSAPVVNVSVDTIDVADEIQTFFQTEEGYDFFRELQLKQTERGY